MPAGEEFGALVYEAFHQVEVNQSVRLDNTFTWMPSPNTGKPEPVLFQRFIMGARFPDMSGAVLSLIVPKQDISIDGLEIDDSLRKVLSLQPCLEAVEPKFDQISQALEAK